MKAGGYVVREDDKRRKKLFEKGGRNLFNIEDRNYLKGR